MNTLLPEKGIRFDPSKVDVSLTLAPPYDVINDRERQELAQMSPHNIVHVILPEGEADAKYRQAAMELRRMLDAGALVRDNEEAFYVYDQEFSLPTGEKVTRRGVIGRLQIQDKSEVLAHEKTLDAPKEDRFKLFRATGVVASQVFTFYADPQRLVEKAIESAEPDVVFDVTLKDGVRHRLSRVTDANACQAITRALQDKELFIADGHHRFETQRNYRNFRRGMETQVSGDEPFNFASVYAANVFQEGLVILSINRLFYGVAGFDPAGFKVQTAGFLDWSEPFGQLDEALGELQKAGKNGTAFVFVLKEDRPVPYLVKAKQDAKDAFVNAGVLHPAVASLDVSFLHHKVVNDVLGIDPAMVARREHIEYEHDPYELVHMMQSDPKFQVGVVLNPVKVEQIMAVAEAGEKMPQKSTFFFPKLFSGIVIHPLERDVPPRT